MPENVAASSAAALSEAPADEIAGALFAPGDVAGQRRTGKAKKFTVFKAGESGLVFKGPYKVDFAADRRLAATFHRARALEAWGAAA